MILQPPNSPTLSRDFQMEDFAGVIVLVKRGGSGPATQSESSTHTQQWIITQISGLTDLKNTDGLP